MQLHRSFKISDFPHDSLHQESSLTTNHGFQGLSHFKAWKKHKNLQKPCTRKPFLLWVDFMLPININILKQSLEQDGEEFVTKAWWFKNHHHQTHKTLEHPFLNPQRNSSFPHQHHHHQDEKRRKLEWDEESVRFGWMEKRRKEENSLLLCSNFSLTSL